MIDPAEATPPAANVDGKGNRGKRILLATFGSFGDLHPYIALARGLQARGHHAVIATSTNYREKIEGEGIGFHAIRPDLPANEDTRKLIGRIMDPKHGTEVIFREVLGPSFAAQYADLAVAAEGADLLVAHILTPGIRMVAELTHRPWVATFLQPMVFTSPYDPPIPPQFPQFAPLYRLGPGFNRRVLELGKRSVRPFVQPIHDLRASLGLPDAGHAMFEGGHSPFLNLALFSRELGAPQPDWPARTVVTGFPFYDRFEAGAGMPEALEAFLRAGDAPIVFTLGSSAVMLESNFYQESVDAARRLGRRAVLLIGREEWNALPRPLPDGIFACDYAPHSELFPRAAAIIHQGGVGTTGQAMRAGKPMLVVPFAHDQPDNAHRVTRLGIARTLTVPRYTGARAAAELRALLDYRRYAERAAAVGARVRAEDGVGTACNAMEELLVSPWSGTAPGRPDR
jgi:UDP:flavonoid glycosyltransferase YjiC (YdhE family)